MACVSGNWMDKSYLETSGRPSWEALSRGEVGNEPKAIGSDRARVGLWYKLRGMLRDTPLHTEAPSYELLAEEEMRRRT